MAKVVEPSIFIIFGGTGDLARRKLLPALARLHAAHQLHPKSHVVGVAIESEYDSAKYRRFTHDALLKAGVEEEVAAGFTTEQLHYHCIGDCGPADFDALSHMLRSIERANGLPENRAFYLALPPQVFLSTIDGLGAAGLNKSHGWTRVVVEKPFGHDLATAQALNRDIHRWYEESQVYRIDHYLGKDTVQNLLVLRFANTIFESVWNRDRIEAVQITVAEDLGVGTRAGYYDKAGAFRDMVQNHLTQLLTLVAMEIPSRYEAEAIRYEKIKVLRSMRALDPNAVVRGQYAAGEVGGEAVPGYLDEPGIDADSDTETFVGMTVFVDNWRWAGVPFFLRTGKRMGKTLSQIAVRLRSTPSHLFASLGEDDETADVLVISPSRTPGSRCTST
ncbi:MAG: glucose-6-phosphate dehydrogenase [Deltaproteobacteria bacterium]|nr:glucose-6-phosphate dehydrogenase [Deltaproteobacteria bacterium]